jgi:hypothetical protein
MTSNFVAANSTGKYFYDQPMARWDRVIDGRSIGVLTGCGGPLGNCGTLGAGPWSELSGGRIGKKALQPGRAVKEV